MSKNGKRVLKIYDAMFERFGGQNWWPAETPFECIVGAILTQNTSWKNVEKSIRLLKSEMTLSPANINKIPRAKLARLIKSSGYFNQKSRRLKIFARFVVDNYVGSIGGLLSEKRLKLRKTLLKIEGIGPETADSIVLYAARKPSFVVDAYTKRITARHGLTDEKVSYETVQKLFENNLPRRTALFNEYHALIVRTAKEFCHKKRPDCENCPIRWDLDEAGLKAE